MTPRERILASANHQKVDKMPTDMWAVVEVQEMLYEHFDITVGKDTRCDEIGLMGGILNRGVEAQIELYDKLGVDGIFDIRPPYLGDKRRTENGITYNEWGFGYKAVEYGTGTYQEQAVFPLEDAEEIEDLEAFEWPSPDDYDYSKIPEIIDRCGGRAVACGYYALVTFHQYLRGLENQLMDPLDDPEFANFLIKKLSDFNLEYQRRCFEAAEGRIDFTQVTDDWGAQTGLLSSPEIFDEFYRPGMEQAIALAKEFGVKTFHHDDGDCRPLFPRLLEMDIDVLNPLQWRCGNWDLAELQRDYGKHFCFHSGVDNQHTIPFGTAEDVRKEVRILKDTLGNNGSGFIIAPCHNIQAITPVENILALYDEARK